MTCEPSDSTNGWDGVILCIAVFLILVILFRGVRSSKECIIYLDNSEGQAPEAISYAEKEEETPPARPMGPMRPQVSAWNPSAGGGGAPYS